jgi:hypothetical protein
VLDPGGFAVATGGAETRRPSIAFGGGKFLVVWEEWIDGSPVIRGTRMTTSGRALDPEGITVSDESGAARAPKVAFDGTGFLVAWHTRNGEEGDIHAAKIDTAGRVIAPGEIVVSAERGRQWAPDVAYNGRESIVVWGDARRSKRNVDVYAARVASNGAVLDPEGVGVSTDRDNQLLPAVAACDRAQVLVAHSSFVPAAIFGYWRIWGSLWEPPEEAPLELTLSVHQNPILTSELDIVLVPSKTVQDTTVWIAVDDTSVETDLTDASANIYRGSFRLTRPDVVSIVGGASDLLGIPATVSRDFGVGLVERDRGGAVASPDGAVFLRCPGGAVIRGSYVMIGAEPGAVDEWTISPVSLELGRPAVLEVELDAGRAVSGGTPSLWRKTSSSWESVGCGYDPATGVLTALVNRFGRLKVTWEAAGAGSLRQSILLSNVPNPFVASLEVRYMLAAAGDVDVRVYDAAGRLVRTLFSGRRGPGWHSEAWDGLKESGTPAPGGVYFTTVATGGKRASAKCVLIR